MATNPVNPDEQPDPGVNPLAVAPANKPAHKPDDQLTDDSAIAPKDKHESPFEQRITDTDPHRDLHPDEDDDAFNEFRSPGEDMDLHEAHDPRANMGLSTGMPGTDRFRPVPLWAIVGCTALVAFSFMYLGAYSGGFQGDVFSSAVNYHPVSGPPVDPNSPEAMAATGAKVFVQNCVQCHQVSGLGQAGQYPPLVASEWVLGPPKPHRANPAARHPGHDPRQGRGLQQPDARLERVVDGQADRAGAHLRPHQARRQQRHAHHRKGDGRPPVRLTVGHSDSWTESRIARHPGRRRRRARPGAAPGAPQAVANPPTVTPGGNNKPSAADLGQGPAIQPAPKP